MKQIIFDSGIKEYAVNGDENNVIRINAADLNLGKRLSDMQGEIEELQEKYRNIDDPTAEELYELDTEIRRIIDTAFGTDVSSHAFGNVNCCSPTGSGKLLFESFTEAFMPILAADIEAINRDKTEIRPEVKKYLKDKETTEFTEEQKRRLLELLA